MDFDAGTDNGPKPQGVVRELEHNEARYRALFGHNPDPIFVLDSDCLIVSGNSALESISGYKLNELVSRPFTDLLVMADREHALRHVGRALSGTAQVLEVIGANRDGREFTVSLSVFPMWDETQIVGVYGIARDITAHKDAERALRDSEERYRLLAEHVQDLISLHDLEGRFLYATPSAMELLGIHPVELIGRSVYELVLPEDVAALQEAHRDILARNGKGPLAYRAFRVDGTVRWFESTARMTEPDHTGERRIVSATRDITDRRQLEQRLTQSEKLEAIGRLAGGIAHDFNNLLTVISGQAQLALAQVQRDSKIMDQLDAVCEAAGRATALTTQLLTFGKQQMTRPAVLNLNESILGLHGLMRRLVSEDVVIATNLATDLWAVQIDPAQLEQVVINLVVNARDAMPKGGTLTIMTANITPAAAFVSSRELERAEYVLFRVSDTGEGMDDETAKRAFEPFFSSKGSAGTGLGLPTVYGIVQQAGGVVTLKSDPGEGTVVMVYLRRSIETPRPPEFDGTTIPDNMHGTECVLVAEDDTGVRALVEAVLERYGYRVVLASSGEEAVDVFGSLDADPAKRVDLVIADVIMPRMGGADLASQLRSRRPGLPILFMSGYTSDALARKGLSGKFDLLNKPFRPETLAASVRRLLDRAAAAS